MTLKKDIKRVMKEIKQGIKHHRNLQKKVLNTKKGHAAEGKTMLGASRKHLNALFAREEVLENRLIDRPKTVKSLMRKSNGVTDHRPEGRAEA